MSKGEVLELFSYLSYNFYALMNTFSHENVPAFIALKSRILYSLFCHHKAGLLSSIRHSLWTSQLLGNMCKGNLLLSFEYFIQTANSNEVREKQRIVRNHCTRWPHVLDSLIQCIFQLFYSTLPLDISYFKKCVGLIHEYGYQIIIGYTNFEPYREGR